MLKEEKRQTNEGERIDIPRLLSAKLVGEIPGISEKAVNKLAGEGSKKQKKNHVFSNGNYLGNPETGNSLLSHGFATEPAAGGSEVLEDAPQLLRFP